MTFLVSYGYMGILIAAFLAASILPFSSEAVMVGLQAAGLDPVALIAYGTIGNVLGSMFNYTIGRLGKMEWIEKYLHVKKEDLDKAHKFMAGKGAWMGLLSVIPVIGGVIPVALGLMRADVVIVVISVTISKLARYMLLVYGASLIL